MERKFLGRGITVREENPSGVKGFTQLKRGFHPEENPYVSVKEEGNSYCICRLMMPALRGKLNKLNADDDREPKGRQERL